MSSISFTVGTAATDLVGRLEQLAREVPGAAEEALRLCAEDVSRKSQELTPVDTGDLRASTFAEPVHRTATVLRTTVSAGRGLDYAIPVHERTRARHRVGQALFLKTAFLLEAGGGFFEFKVGNYMRQALQRRGFRI